VFDIYLTAIEFGLSLLFSNFALDQYNYGSSNLITAVCGWDPSA